ncbi:type I-C CRISPR-associated protein Cas8c/Csd1 [Nocardia sp. IBHARD005]|uniref:type I-C CRISPR-associated protein Cas8c/Csd1 n=1 Tax=Nocardia sp. IBHARD005 TaxID=3457765 RepID=UPI004059BA54
MLLERLTAYARENSEVIPAFHREREFRWKLDIRTRSNSEVRVRLIATPDPERPKRGMAHLVPASTRTVGVSAHLGADDVQYVLGWADEDANPVRVGQCHAAFVALIDRWAAEVPVETDAVPHRLAAVLRSGALATVERPEEVRAKDGVVIALDGRYVHESSSAAKFWGECVGEAKGSGRTGLCMVCGRSAALANTIPAKVPAALIPGASNDAALVSVNERVFGYDLAAQLTHIPICFGCADDMMGGLTSLLSSPHSVSFPGQNSRLAWWVTDPGEADHIGLVFDPDPAAVLGLFASVGSGHSARRSRGRFCWLAVGGNVARIMVREYVDIALADGDGATPSHDANIAAWFRDHRNTPRNTTAKILANGNEIRAGVWEHRFESLVLALGRWDRRTKGYRPFGAKDADRPDTASHQLFRVAILNRPVPVALRAHLIHRIRNDGRIDDRRAALARLALARATPRPEEPSIPMTLDETCTDPAYVSGRLFAALESTQRWAHSPIRRTTTPQPDSESGPERSEVNSTFGDRYLRRAIDTPRSVLVQGRKESIAWITKLRRLQASSGNGALKRLDDLYALLEVGGGAPRRNTLRQQEQFILGYHHQRAAARSAATENQQ